MKRVFLVISALVLLAGCREEEIDTRTPEEEVPQLQIRCVSGDVTDVTHASATFNGWISVEGAEEGSRVSASIYYSLTEGSAVQLKSAGKHLEAGDLPSTGGGFKVEATGLEPLTKYFYVAAAEAADTLVFGIVRSFTTDEAPKDLSVTGEASALTEFSARISGYVYPKEDTGEFTHGFELSSFEDMSDSTIVAASALDDENAYYAYIDSLSTDTDYFYRAYVRRGEEYAYGETKSFHTLPVAGTVATLPASGITEFKALVCGKMDIETVAETGRRAWFLLGMDPELSKADSLSAQLQPDGSFSFLADTLSYGKTYYYKAFSAIDYCEYYEKVLSGEVLSFSTADITPSLETREAEDITEFKATVRGFLEPGNLEPVEISVWFMYGTDPQNLDHRIESELSEDGSFHLRLNQLDYATTYYYKACCRVYDREVEASVLSFRTLDITAKVTTLPAASVTEFTATLEASLTEVSNDTFGKEVWFLYAPSGSSFEDLLEKGRRVQSSLGSEGSFSVSLSALDYGAGYSYVACAKVYDKTFYGDVLSFTTVDIQADVNTGDAISVTEFNATLTGSLVDRSDDRFSKGIYFFYSTSAADVTTLKNLGIKVRAEYLGDGAFETAISGLEPGREYYYVAYLRVYDAEFFGEIKSFTTKAISADVSAPGASDVSFHKATLCGSLDSASNYSLETRSWFLWTDDSSSDKWTKVSSTLVDGVFNAQLTGLESGKTYYYVACISLYGYEFRSPVVAFTTRIPPDGSVDLGLSVCWSSCNYDAEVLSGTGSFLTWDQAVAAAVSSGLSLPTYAQLDELRKYCTWTWTSRDSIPGYLVIGKNGNSIFLPAAGYYTSNGKYVEEDSGIWSSQTRSSDPGTAFYLRFNASMSGVSTVNASARFPVRMVYD